MERWPILVANKSKTDPEQVIPTFLACFRKGDRFSKYAELLSTARHNENPERTGGEFSWVVDFGDGPYDGDIELRVRYEGDLTSEGNPAIIVELILSPILH